MATRIISCPSCGGKIEFQASAYLPGVCTYCGVNIAPVKNQTSPDSVKLDKDKKVINISALPALENKAKKKGLSLSKLLIAITLVGGVFGFLAWQKSNEYTGYWKQWETTLKQMPCKPPSALLSKNPQVQLKLGSFAGTGFLYSASKALGDEFSKCLLEQVEFKKISTKNASELILGSVTLFMKPGAPIKIVKQSILLHQITPDWKLDIYNEQKTRPEIKSLVSRHYDATDGMWRCWVQFGVFNRKGSELFNKYTGNRLSLPIRLVINPQGEIAEAIIAKPKSKDSPSTWEDQPDFYQCMNTSAKELGPWPPAPHGQIYKVALQLEIHRKLWE